MGIGHLAGTMQGGNTRIGTFVPVIHTIAPASDDRVLAATNHELVEQTKLRATEDFKEGVKATTERRVANFKGQ